MVKRNTSELIKNKYLNTNKSLDKKNISKRKLINKDDILFDKSQIDQFKLKGREQKRYSKLLKYYTDKNFNASYTLDKNRFYNELKKINKSFSTNDISMFFQQNAYLAQFSGEQRAPRRKRKLIYRKTLNSNLILDNFQIDLYQVPKRYQENVSTINYVLVCIDTVSRYIFLRKLTEKNQLKVSYQLINIIKEVRRMKEQYKLPFSGIESFDYLTFVSDLGEFKLYKLFLFI